MNPQIVHISLLSVFIMMVVAQITTAQTSIVSDTFYSPANTRIDRSKDPEYQKRFANTKYFQVHTPSLIHNDGPVDINVQQKIAALIRKYKDIEFTPSEHDTSSFVYLKQASYYSHLSDSVSSGYCLKKMAPWHIRSILDLTCISLDSFLSRFVTTHEADHAVSLQVNKLPPASATYDTFKNYYFRIITLKKELDTATGSDNKRIAEDQLLRVDSLQLSYLRTYIFSNGWPSISDGSFFAGMLASRDIKYSYFYFDYLSQALHANKVALSVVKDIEVNWHYLYTYTIVEESERLVYRKYDVTPFKDMYISKFLTAPELCNWIFTDIKKNCGKLLDFFFIYYAKDLEKSGRQLYLEFDKDNTECIELEKEIRTACPVYFSSENHVYGRHYFLPNYNYMSDKEFFYVVYEK